MRRKGLTIVEASQAHGANRLFALISKGRLNQNGLLQDYKDFFSFPHIESLADLYFTTPAYTDREREAYSLPRTNNKSCIDDRQEELYTTKEQEEESEESIVKKKRGRYVSPYPFWVRGYRRSRCVQQ